MFEKDDTRYGMPRFVRHCTQCVISNQRPSSNVEMKNGSLKRKGIAINDAGVCDACAVNNFKAQINWEQREQALFEILDKYRSADGSFDVVVPSSGGKDSSFTAHILKQKYGMNPLCVTWAPTVWAKDGWKNFDNLTRIGGCDSLLVTPNGDLHRHLTRLSFQNLGHAHQPFIHGQKVIGPKIAKQFGIKLVMYGENQAEYGNSAAEFKRRVMSKDFFTHDQPDQILLGGKTLSWLLVNSKFRFRDFYNYIPLTTQDVQQSQIEQTYLGYFLPWNPQEVYYYAVENTGFQPASERSPGTYSRYSEIDDKFIPIHFYMMHLKFGLGRASYEASQEIRNGQLLRSEAVNLVRKFDGELPQKWMPEICDYLDISFDEFLSVANSYRADHLWHRKVGGDFEFGCWVE